jgi:hypothetical protein
VPSAWSKIVVERCLVKRGRYLLSAPRAIVEDVFIPDASEKESL